VRALLRGRTRTRCRSHRVRARRALGLHLRDEAAARRVREGRAPNGAAFERERRRCAYAERGALADRDRHPDRAGARIAAEQERVAIAVRVEIQNEQGMRERGVRDGHAFDRDLVGARREGLATARLERRFFTRVRARIARDAHGDARLVVPAREREAREGREERGQYGARAERSPDAAHEESGHRAEIAAERGCARSEASPHNAYVRSWTPAAAEVESVRRRADHVASQQV